MSPSPPPEAVLRDEAGCAVAAAGVVQVPFDAIPALRKAPGPPAGPPIPPSLLKHSDHQTVVALAAVLRAIDDAGWQGRSFAGWGVVAAPRFLGRVVGAVFIDKFCRLGAPGVSPLIIPYLSLHSVAGAISLALKAHGFNYGVGGGPGHLGEALLAGLAARDDGDVPGLWVVATEWDPEPVPNASGGCQSPTRCCGVALGLVPGAAGRSRLHLRLVPAAATGPEVEAEANPEVEGAPPVLSGLVRFLADLSGPARHRRWYCPLPGGGAIEIDDDPARAEKAGDDVGRTPTATRAG